MEIRVCEAKDIESVVDFMSDMFDITYKGIFSDAFLVNFRDKRKERLEVQYKGLERRPNNLIGAFDNGKLIGFVEVDKCHHKEYSEHGELTMIYVDPNYQGMGIGKTLFREAAKHLKELGYKDFYVGCANGNTKAQKFYYHMGGIYVFSKGLNLDQVYQEDYFYYGDVDKFI